MSDVKTYGATKMVPVGKLKPYGNNSRTHSQEQINQVAASIREFGFTNPILISDDFTIIAGHGRFFAAETLGMSKVPCIKLSGLNEEQRRAYVIADNKLAEQAGWDKELLSLELGSLERADFQLDLLGFTERELEKLLSEETGNPVAVPTVEPDELAVVVSCGTPEEQQAAYDLLAGAGFSCRTADLKGTVKGR